MTEKLYMKNYMKRIEKFLKNDCIKMHFCISTSIPNCIFHFEKKKSNRDRIFFSFLKWNFQNSIFMFPFFRIHQNCIFFRYLFSFKRIGLKLWMFMFVFRVQIQFLIFFLKFPLEISDSSDWVNFSKQDFTFSQVYFVYLKNETFKIQFSYFRLSRIYQDCIFFLYFSVFSDIVFVFRQHIIMWWTKTYWHIFSIFLWILKPILWLSYLRLSIILD